MELNTDSAVSQLTTIRDWLRWTCSRFFEAEIALGHGSDTYWDEAVFLVLQALYLPPTTDNRVLNSRLTLPERYKVAEWVQRRAIQREPLPYITQVAWQQGMGFYVDHRVLIPRSPIAHLMAEGLEPWLDHVAPPSRVLDMCTGSGCLAILSTYAFPEAQVDGVDISTDALTVAAFNVNKYGLDQRIRLIKSDGFKAFPEPIPYDVILANPPYVDANDMANIAPEFRFEPALALESGEDGLQFTHQFLSQVAGFLSEQGFVVLEVGNSWEALEAAYPSISFIWLELEHAVGITVLTQEECQRIAPLAQALTSGS